MRNVKAKRRHKLDIHQSFFSSSFSIIIYRKPLRLAMVVFESANQNLLPCFVGEYQFFTVYVN